MAAMVGRISRAMGRRAEAGDVLALHALREMRESVEIAEGEAARSLHHWGLSWGDLGRELGITRQAAQKKYGRR